MEERSSGIWSFGPLATTARLVQSWGRACEKSRVFSVHNTVSNPCVSSSQAVNSWVGRFALSQGDTPRRDRCLPRRGAECPRSSGAFSVSIESKRGFSFLIRRVFSTRTGLHGIKSGAGFRLKTLSRRAAPRCGKPGNRHQKNQGKFRIGRCEKRLRFEFTFCEHTAASHFADWIFCAGQSAPGGER